MSFTYVLLALNMLTARQVPTGTPLQVRLTTAVSSFASKAGDFVWADLIVPVTVNGETLLPARSVLSGTVKSVQRVGLGVIHENAALNLELNRITLPNGESYPITARVQAVDTGRERVTKEGSIRGERPTGSLAYRTGSLIRWAIGSEFHGALALWAIKMILVQVPEPELYYPSGVELTLKTIQPAVVPAPIGPTATTQRLNDEERGRMDPLVQSLPARSYDPEFYRPSDLINLMFVGSREQLTTAFEASGWTEAHTANLKSHVRQIRAVAEGHGYLAAPMSSLLVNNTGADMSWQKGFNDTSKRHHIRIWKEAQTWDGDDIWVGAATRDIDFAYLRPGHALTHKIDPNIDNEREKIVHDLVFTSCVDMVDWFDRPHIPSYTRNATGDPINTDARLAVIGLNACESPRRSLPIAAADTLPMRGNHFYRLVRREILSARSDLLRENIYWRSYEGIRWTIVKVHERKDKKEEDPREPREGSDRELAEWKNRSHGFWDVLR